MSIGIWSLVVKTAAISSLTILPMFGQSVRSLVREGNDQYNHQKYGDAEVSYRKALEKADGLVPGHYNLGNALYKQQKADEAIKEYETAVSKAESKETRAETYYNMGNAFMKGQRYQEAVNSYVESLKLQPGDQDAKYNLSYALEKLKERQQQKKNDKNKDDKQDKQKNQQDQNQKNQDQQEQNHRNDQQPQQNPQQEGQHKKMAKADAERMLDVLKNSEKDVQKKLRVRPAARAKTDKDW